MKKFYFIGIILTLFVVIYSCNQNKSKKEDETILTGEINVLVDETILPVIEDQELVFESQYKGKVNLIAKSETEIIQLLSQGKYDLAILTRELSVGESNFFKKNHIKGVVTPLATDGIAFIGNKSIADVKIDLQDVIYLMQGKSTKIAGLVFDNANSSTVRYFKELAKIDQLPKDKIFSFKNNNEVIKFVAENKGMIGVVGVNWIMQPLPDFQHVVDNVSVLEVKTKNGTFALPTQDHIASGVYPLTREIKMLNYEGKTALGMGFASFIAGQIGQRIILKSGLVPYKMPIRNIIIRDEIEKKH